MSFFPSVDGLFGKHLHLPQNNPPPTPPPADPNAPGLTLDEDVEYGSNHFQLGIEGPSPLFAVGGDESQQNEQLAWTAALSLLAIESYATGHTPVTVREPSDFEVVALLGQLDPIPPLGTDGEEVTHAVYQSEIPNATARDGYEHFVNHPGEVFGAAGLEIRPPTQQLQDGGRYMLELGTPVPTWLPVEITLDPVNHAITITTLDGHLLRGEQTFTFTDDGQGGTVLTQDARFQAGSALPTELQALTPIADGQHNSWQHAHREIYEQFNGDPDYKGIGTDFSVSNLIGAWQPILVELVTNPGNTADMGIDITGALANAGIDATGEGIEAAFNYLEIPGGGVIAQGFDKLGDAVTWAADHIGDGVEIAVNIQLAPVILLGNLLFGGGEPGPGSPPVNGTTTTTEPEPTPGPESSEPESDAEPESTTATGTTTTTTTTTIPGDSTD